jgi:hypothetical protein
MPPISRFLTGVGSGSGCAEDRPAARRRAKRDTGDDVADFYEDEVDVSIASLTSIIEPVMMIGVGFMVGTIVISMHLPMFKMLQLVH